MADIGKLIAAAREVYPKRSTASTELSKLGPAAVPFVLSAFRTDAESAESSLWWNVLADMALEEVVPLFAQALDQGESIGVSLALFQLLGASRDVQALEPLLRVLGGATYRNAAIDALGEIGVISAIEPLRSSACEILGEIGAVEGVRSACEEALDEDDASDLRRLIHIAVALAKLGDDDLGYAISVLSAFHRDEEEPYWEAFVVRMEAVRALQVVVAKDNIPRLGQAMHDSDSEVVENAINGCLYLGAPTSAVHLVTALKSCDRVNRQQAVRALGRLLGGHYDGEDEEFADACLERADQLRTAKCIRSGRPMDLRLLFPLLNHSDEYANSRIELQLATGIDFVPAPALDWSLDLDGEARANKWWEKNGHRFEIGRLYRYGRLIA